MIHTLMRLLRLFWNWIQRLLRQRSGGTVITLDTGRRVILGQQIAEGGFSFVFEATSALDDSQRGSGDQKYALKRIHCPDPELLQACRAEAAVHRSVQHPNLMPLLGMSIQHHCCYMLFPMCQQSLRDAVNQRNPLIVAGACPPQTHPPQPWPELTALNLFLRICAGVQTLHEKGGYTHRDIKLENILLLPSHKNNNNNSNQQQQQPVLMDFGSAGPLQRTLTTRRDVLSVMDEAAQHTTLPYRPPELFEGGVRTGYTLDYRAVDVWSLACTLHALLYGASPFECDFGLTTGGGCSIRIVDCTHLSVLGNVPIPRGAVADWYRDTDWRTQLLEPMLSQDPARRPTLPEVIAVTERLIQQLGGTVDRTTSGSSSLAGTDDDDDAELENEDGISLMSKVV